MTQQHQENTAPAPELPRRCLVCAKIKYDRRTAERRGDLPAMRAAATRMGIHLREAH
ncbi:hypothetical protein GCM10010218_07970 [Streptomyces mashuensis]|uniref:Uncharacterized protein n=1 Tax=Streptomyces mashuensis TaxID=33904 RepID=A0A919AW13_9ACTN|nr:hypothetical protein [Streptomyces mashuensis]GHF29220.1 hypothetical protein GCM10010218_07970 [Streptomyces mashuensis]